MKKILPLILLAGIGFLSYSCDNSKDEVVVPAQDPVYSTAYDIIPQFVKQSNNLYRFKDDFKSPLIESDVVLVYRQLGNDGGAPVWKLMPYTYHVDSVNSVDYLFDFSKFGISIYVNSNDTFNLSSYPEYYQNIKFRVVVVPAKTGTSKMANPVDYSDYNSVIKYYNIDESKIQTKH